MPVQSHLQKENDAINCNLFGAIIFYLFIVAIATGLWTAMGCLSGYIGHQLVILEPRYSSSEKFTLDNSVQVMMIGSAVSGAVINLLFSGLFYMLPINNYAININEYSSFWEFYWIYFVIGIPVSVGVGAIEAMVGTSILGLLPFEYDRFGTRKTTTESDFYASVGALGNTFIVIMFFVIIPLLRIIHVKYYVYSTIKKDNRTKMKSKSREMALT